MIDNVVSFIDKEIEQIIRAASTVDEERITSEDMKRAVAAYKRNNVFPHDGQYALMKAIQELPPNLLRRPPFCLPRHERASTDVEAALCFRCLRRPLHVTNAEDMHRLECVPCGASTHFFSSADAARECWSAMNESAQGINP